MDHATFQQKLKDFECRVRKWRQLRFGFSESRPKRSTSQDPRKANGCPSATSSPSRFQLQSIPVGCRTSPMDRKLVLNFGGPGSSYQQPEQAEIDRTYAAVQANSGKITILGTVYNVNWGEMRLLGEVGHGSCGHVSKYKYRDYIMAVKTMPRSNNIEENKRIIMDLGVVTKTGDCPNIVRCYGYFVLQSTVSVCMEMMATCLDRLLKKIQQPFPEDVVGKICVDVVTALDYLKTKHNIMHRDVKPSNILINWDGVVKMCDFGISGILVESKAHSVQAGCPPYMAPERLNADVRNSTIESIRFNYDVRSDVWSLGISIVELATGKYPYPASTEFEILASIIEKPAPILLAENGFSKELCDFVAQCLCKEYLQRPKFYQLLEHPFIQHHNHALTDVGEWLSSVLNDDVEMES